MKRDWLSPLSTVRKLFRSSVNAGNQLENRSAHHPEISESVREHQAGLQSFRSMRRIEARRRKASALRLRFSQSLASLRQRLSHAMVRSTIQRLGKTTNSLT